MLEAFKVAWAAWRRLLRGVGRTLDAALMAAVYLLVLGPLALVARAFGKRFLDTGTRASESPPPVADLQPSSLERARRRY